MHAQDVSNPQQAGDMGVGSAGLDLLVRGAGDVGGEEDALLGPVLAQSRDADAVTDGAALPGEPGVVIGQRWHARHRLTKIIISQPGQPGLL